MGTIKTTNIETITGSGTLTLGQSGETISVPSGVTMSVPSGGISGQNYPAFEAYLSAGQDSTDDANVKVQLDTVILDTDSCFDNTTNYRFTPTVAGKYYVYGSVVGSSTGGASTIVHVYSYIYKNGSAYKFSTIDFRNNYGNQAGPAVSAIIDMNGSTDYLELYGSIDTTSGTPRFNGSSDRRTYLGAYRIGS